MAGAVICRSAEILGGLRRLLRRLDWTEFKRLLFLPSVGYAQLCGLNHRGVTIALDSFLRGQLVSFYTASNRRGRFFFGAIGISVGSQASVMLDLGLILERIFTL